MTTAGHQPSGNGVLPAYLQSGDNDIRIPAYGHDDILPDTIYHLRYVPTD